MAMGSIVTGLLALVGFLIFLLFGNNPDRTWLVWVFWGSGALSAYAGVTGILSGEDRNGMIGFVLGVVGFALGVFLFYYLSVGSAAEALAELLAVREVERAA